jgi:hypothetical protein
VAGCLFVHSLLLWEVAAAAARVTTLLVLCVFRRLAEVFVAAEGGGFVCLLLRGSAATAGWEVRGICLGVLFSQAHWQL